MYSLFTFQLRWFNLSSTFTMSSSPYFKAPLTLVSLYIGALKCFEGDLSFYLFYYFLFLPDAGLCLTSFSFIAYLGLLVVISGFCVRIRGPVSFPCSPP